MNNGLLNGHPKGLYLLFFVEMWERFSYYGMRALFVLYMIEYLFSGYTDKVLATERAGLVYGLYTGLVYLTPLIGGYIADRYKGQRKCISVGLIFMVIGLIILAVSDVSALFQYSFQLFILGLFCLILSNGFMKSNISTIVGMLYGNDTQKRDTGFTIFYMGTNIGALFSPLVCGTIATIYGIKYGFLAGGIGALIGYIIYKIGEKPLLQEHGLLPYTDKKDENNDNLDKPLTLRERRKLYALFILMIFSVIFWLSYEQAGSSMMLFAQYESNRVINIFGHSFEMPAQYFQSLNPLFIILLAPLTSMLWTFLNSRKKEPNSVVKFNIALLLISVSYLVMAFAGYLAKTHTVSPLWLVIVFFIATVAELCISPIGLSLVTKLAPVKFASLVMGCWFLASFAGNFGAGALAGNYAKISHDVFFLIVAGISALAALLLFILTPVLKKWMGKS